jgi:hypothetical protein
LYVLAVELDFEIKPSGGYEPWNQLTMMLWA